MIQLRQPLAIQGASWCESTLPVCYTIASSHSFFKRLLVSTITRKAAKNAKGCLELKRRGGGGGYWVPAYCQRGEGGCLEEKKRRLRITLRGGVPARP